MKEKIIKLQKEFLFAYSCYTSEKKRIIQVCELGALKHCDCASDDNYKTVLLSTFIFYEWKLSPLVEMAMSLKHALQITVFS